MSTIAIDIGFIAVVFISLLIGAYRGFVRSLLSVVSWVVAVWVTWKFAGLTVPLFDGLNMGPTVQLIVAHLVVFFGVLLVVAIISALLAKVLVVEGIAGLDKTLGIAFGAVRGVLIVLLIAVIGSFTFILHEPWWQESTVLNLVEPYVFMVRESLSIYLSPEVVSEKALDISQVIRFEHHLIYS